MSSNYFFIDGSALTAQIRYLFRVDNSFQGRKLCPKLMTEYFMSYPLRELHGNTYKRVTFYFPAGDEVAVGEYLKMPNLHVPGALRDINFKFCGQKIKKSKEFDEFVESTVPKKFQGRFSKSEKGIDIEICCDAFKLANSSHIERLFLFTNDDDFLPFCKAIKEFGTNISLLHLSDIVNANSSLLKEVDSYDVIPYANLQRIFLPIPDVVPDAIPANAQAPAVTLQKSDAAPSDMIVDGASPAVELVSDSSETEDAEAEES